MSDRICDFPECGRPRCAKGLCRTHYNQQREGRPLAPIEIRRSRGSLEQLFFARVAPDGDCWRWLGSRDGKGYGRFQSPNLVQAAHRFAYELLRCEIPDGLALDHLCRNRWCVNPWHLDPVPNAVNVARGESPPAINARKTHCIRGHEYTLDNTKVSSRGWRSCRECQRSRKRRTVAT